MSRKRLTMLIVSSRSLRAFSMLDREDESLSSNILSASSPQSMVLSLSTASSASQSYPSRNTCCYNRYALVIQRTSVGQVYHLRQVLHNFQDSSSCLRLEEKASRRLSQVERESKTSVTRLLGLEETKDNFPLCVEVVAFLASRSTKTKSSMSISNLEGHL